MEEVAFPRLNAHSQDMSTQSQNAEEGPGDFEHGEAPMRPLLLTVPEAAAVLSVGRTTLYELIGAGEISVVHIGRSCRVPAAAIHDFVAAKRAFG
jgi:excisionase family DNA binding protein